MVIKKPSFQHKVSKDRFQTRLVLDSDKGCEIKPTIVTKEIQIVEGTVMCPFCLHVDPMKVYLIATKKGYDRRLGQCPECKQKMTLDTLRADWTPEQFAEWAYNYTTSGYWQKVTFRLFKDRLYKMGLATRFWSKYRELKGTTEEDEESLDDKYDEYTKYERELGNIP